MKNMPYETRSLLNTVRLKYNCNKPNRALPKLEQRSKRILKMEILLYFSIKQFWKTNNSGWNKVVSKLLKTTTSSMNIIIRLRRNQKFHLKQQVILSLFSIVGKLIHQSINGRLGKRFLLIINGRYNSCPEKKDKRYTKSKRNLNFLEKKKFQLPERSIMYCTTQMEGRSVFQQVIKRKILNII